MPRPTNETNARKVLPMNRLALIFALFLCAGHTYAQAPEDVRAFDTPNDQGRSITLTWRRAESLIPGARYLILIAESPEGPFYTATEIDAAAAPLQSTEPATFGHTPENDDRLFAHIKSYATSADTEKIPLQNNKPYVFQITLGQAQSPIVHAQAAGNFFDWSKLNNFILGSLFSATILFYIGIARRKNLHIRRLAALGRATEMGKPVLFIHGLQDMGSPSTIAAVNILGQVARRTAQYDTQLKVGNRDPIVMSVSQEVVKEACIESGRPDAFNPDNVFLAAADQFSYAAALEGMMVREKPAANLLVGYFYAESLLLAETGSTTGAIQIAATDSYTQLPFFITTCDYTLMGEELYAASAYLSRDPKLLGSLKGQDLGKGIFIAVLLLGTALSTLGYSWLTHIFTSY
ncbi:MAG: hypothetical protein O2954_06020 [bacterium]|nr:hypothetical protein [bacterium]